MAVKIVYARLDLLDAPKAMDNQAPKSSKVMHPLERATRITRFSSFGRLIFHSTPRGVIIMIISLIVSTASKS